MKFLSQINVNTEYTLPMVDGTNGQVLSTDGAGVAYWGTISVGSLPLDGLSDVIITSPSSDQMLRYGLRQGDTVPVWHNFTPNFLTPSSSINALNDVVITTAAAGQILQYNGSNWVNATLSTVEYVSKVQHTAKAGVAIAKGQAVYVTGANGTNMIIGLASNTSEGTSSKTMGIAASAAAVNDIIFVVTEGLLAGINTSTATAGDPVWLGTSGNLIFGLANKPTSPAHLVYIGVVTRVQQNNGEIFVKVQNGIEIDEIHDVQISSPATGQLLRRDSDGYWKNWTPNFLTSLPAHNHNDIYYTESEIDSLFAGETEIDGYNRGAWDIAYNDKINSASFSTTTGVLTLNQQDTGTVTVDLDGRYLESYTETDPTVPSHVKSITATNISNWNDAVNDSIRSASFNTSNGVLTLTQVDLGTVTVDLDGRYITSETDSQTLTWTKATSSIAISNGNSVTLEGLATETFVQSQGYITGISFANVSAKPTTIAGYGITDAITTTNIGNQSVSVATVSRRVIDTPSARITTPEGAYSVGNSSGTGGAIKISLPTTVYNNNTMMSMTVEVYLYSTGQSFTLRIGGYNYYDGTWYNVFASILSDSGKSTNVPVYFGNNGVDRNVIWIGDSNSSWEYPNVFVTDFQSGHSQNESWAKGWSVSFSQSEQTNVTASRIAYRQVDAGNIGSYALTSLPAHNHDDRYYTETESDSRFYLATNPSGYISGISFANVSAKPTTVSGYGITDAITTANIGSQSVSYADYTNRTSRGIIEDTRAAQRIPNNYDDYRVSWEFTDKITGIADWHTAMTMQGWHDGYAAWQIIGPSSTTAHENWYLRSGNTTVWNSLRRIWHNGDFTSTDVSNWNEAYGWGDHAEAGYLTSFSYTETDTLSSVTGRGGSTGSPVVMYGKVTLGNNSSGTYSGNTTGLTLNSTAEVRSTGIQNPPALTWHYEGLATRHLLMTSGGVFNFVSPSNEASGVAVVQVNGNTVWHAGNLTNLNQLTNGPGYITGYTETDTLDTVLSRGTSTTRTAEFCQTSNTFINTVAAGNRGLTVFQNTAGADAYITFHISNDYAGYFGLGGAENDLVWGGWSVGNARHRIFHSGNFTDNSANWNTAYNDRISSATVTGTTTKTLTLTQGDGGTVTASWTDYDTDNDAQQLTWNKPSITLSISNGNSIALEGLATEEFVTGQGYITGSYLPLSGGTVTGTVTANRFSGRNTLVLNNYTTVNPASNVFLYSQPNDRDAWIFLDSADTGSNWGIYHRQIDSAVGDIPGNSLGFVGGGASALQAYINLANGDAYFRGNLVIGGTFTEQSSIRYKKDVVGIESTSDRVELLKPVRYKKIENDAEEIGLIAEDVVELFPEVVKYDNEGRPDGINYSRLSVILLKAVQELTERVNKLENK
jgi:hypothetical protein